MNQSHLLILNPSATEAERLSGLASKFGPVIKAPDVESLQGRMESVQVGVAVIDVDLAAYGPLKKILPATTAVVLTGGDERALRQAADEWPANYFVDVFFHPTADPRERAFARALERALEDNRLKLESQELRRALGLQEAKVRDVYAEIQEIKGLINANFIREVEKRIAIEAQYVWYQKERQRLEAILRKIYAADDVSSLLDIIPDIRDIVQASSATVYIIEQNEVIGHYLKPLVWDNAFLSHAEFSKYIALLDSQDFAAAVARYGHPVNIPSLSSDRRMSKRYAEYLKTPPQSLLAVPIMHERRVIGVVEVYNKTVAGKVSPDGFNREDEQVLQGLSEHMAIAMTKLNLIQHDALTGLLRPDAFFEKVLQKVNALSKRRQEEGALALVMGDVDWFKNFNDRNGHEAGNKLLRELAHILKLSIREEDLLCRYGGEEFLFFLTGVKDLDEAAMLTDRIRKNVEDHYFEFQEFQPQNNLTMSFGVTIFPKKKTEPALPMTKTDLKRLAGEADLALAEAKGKRRPDLKSRKGQDSILTKNRVRSYSWDLQGEKKKAEARPAQGPDFRERRKCERTNASTVLMLKDSGSFKVAKTVNISVEGARIVSDAKLPLTKTLETIIVLGDKANCFQSDIMYSEPAEGEDMLFYSGLRFRDLNYQDIRGLEDYLLHFRRRDVSDA